MVGAAAGDRDKAAQAAHEGVSEADHGLSRLSLRQPGLGQQRQDCPRGGHQGGVDGRVLDEERLILTGYLVHRAGVESIPPKPQDQDPQTL